MPAPIKIRPSYSNDSNFLMRLKRAVEIDDRLKTETRGNLLSSIDALTLKLIEADIEIRSAEESKPKRAKG